jgi:hypothetical protein
MLVSLKDELGRFINAPDHLGKPCAAKGRSALRGEHKGALRLLLALQLPQAALGCALIHSAEM